jgi:hypothetical protein
MAPGTPGYPGAPAGPSSNAAAGPSNASDEAEDSGLGLEWVWLNADVGAAYVNMESFSSSSLALQKSSSAGPMFGVGAGVRLLFFTVGARVSDLLLSAFNLWEVSGEAAFHLRVWRIDPYFGARGGYAFVGSLSSDSVQVVSGGTPSAVSVHGFDIGPMVGIDVYLTKTVSLGGDFDMQFLFIQRPPVPLPQLPPGTPPPTLTPAQQALYTESGSSVGLGVTGTVHLGIHF